MGKPLMAGLEMCPYCKGWKTKRFTQRKGKGKKETKMCRECYLKQEAKLREVLVTQSLSTFETECLINKRREIEGKIKEIENE